jgi:hypothetical protein
VTWAIANRSGTSAQLSGRAVHELVAAWWTNFGIEGGGVGWLGREIPRSATKATDSASKIGARAGWVCLWAYSDG